MTEEIPQRIEEGEFQKRQMFLETVVPKEVWDQYFQEPVIYKTINHFLHGHLEWELFWKTLAMALMERIKGLREALDEATGLAPPNPIVIQVNEEQFMEIKAQLTSGLGPFSMSSRDIPLTCRCGRRH